MIRTQLEIWKLQIIGLYFRLRCRWMEWRRMRFMKKSIRQIEKNPEIYHSSFNQGTYLELEPMPDLMIEGEDNDDGSETDS